MRWLRAVALLLSLVLGQQAARAAGTARLSIDVVDALHRSGIALARVALSSDVVTELLYTDKHGRIGPLELPPGTYDLAVYAPGYYDQHVREEVGADQTLSLSVSLAPLSAPKVIARVTATRRPSSGTSRSSADGPAGMASASLLGALGAMPDIGATRGGIAVDGLSPNATALALDGIPAGVGGNSLLLSQLGTELFSAVSVRPVGEEGSPGVDLSAQDPTIAFSAAGDEQLSRYGSGGVVQAQGTSGNVGYVIRHADRDDYGPLDGLTYSDESGLRYVHDDDVDGQGTLVKARVPLNVSQHVLLEASNLTSDQAASCDVDSGGTPCGYGPGNATLGLFDALGIQYGLSAGKTTIDVDASSTHMSTMNVFDSRVVEGSSSPYDGSSIVRAESIRAEIDGPLDVRNTLRAQFWSTTNDVTASIAGAPQVVDGSHFINGSLADDFTMATGASIQTSIQYSRAGSSHVGAVVEARVPLEEDAFSMRAALGDGGLPPLQSLPLLGSPSDPPSVQYDCLTGRVFANAEGAVPEQPSTSGAQFKFVHERGRFALSLFGSAEVVHGAQVPILAVASGVDLDELAALQRFYSSPAACSSPMMLTPSRVLSYSDQNATLSRSNSILSAAWALSPGASISAFVAPTNARILAGREWSSLIYEPYLRAGVIADYHFDRNLSEAIVLAEFQGRNNPNGIGPYGLLNLGLARQLGVGRIVLSLTNATNAYAYRFASSAYAVPLANGITPIATPLQPASLHITYQVKSGAKPPPAQADALSAIAQIAQPAGDAFSVSVSRLPHVPPLAPYEPDTLSPSCTPELVGYARQILEAMQTAARVASAASSNEQLAPALERSLGVIIYVHREPASIAFTLDFQSDVASRAFVSCTDQHFASIDEARALGIYTPQTLPSGDENAEYFDTKVGAYRLFASLRRPGATGTSVDLLPIPVAPPERPFLRRSTCPAQEQNFAAELLARLAQDFSRGGNPTQPSPYFRVLPHTDHASVWWSIQFLDPLSQNVVLRCADVAGATSSDLTKAGVGAVPRAINYSSRLGLYELVEP